MFFFDISWKLSSEPLFTQIKRAIPKWWPAWEIWHGLGTHSINNLTGWRPWRAKQMHERPLSPLVQGKWTLDLALTLCLSLSKGISQILTVTRINSTFEVGKKGCSMTSDFVRTEYQLFFVLLHRRRHSHENLQEKSRVSPAHMRRCWWFQDCWRAVGPRRVPDANKKHGTDDTHTQSCPIRKTSGSKCSHRQVEVHYVHCALSTQWTKTKEFNCQCL